MTEHPLLEKLRTHLEQLLVRIDNADAELELLSASGLGRFDAVLRADQGFSIHANRFRPYFLELAEGFDRLQQVEDPSRAPELQAWLQQLQTLERVLAEFEASVR